MGEIPGDMMVVAALLPLAVVVATFVGPLRRWAWRVAPLSALPALVVSIVGVDVSDDQIEWLFVGSRVGLDTTGRVFLFVTAFVWLVATVFAKSTVIEGGRRHRFFRYFYTAMAGNLLVVVAGDMITFLVGFAMMSYAGWGLVVHEQNEEARRAARIYVAMVVVGEVLLFAGAVTAWGTVGSWELVQVREMLGEGGEVATAAIGLLFLGFGVKAALIPLHVWLPLAHPAAPVAASAVLSATMIKAGLLGWIRFLPFGHSGVEWLGWWGMTAGLVAAFGGVVLGLLQSRPKAILAYSSVSQMGYMTLILSLAALMPGLYSAALAAVLVYVLHHAGAKGALFLSVKLARGAPRQPWWKFAEGAGLVIPALALAGAPLTTGAVAKEELKRVPYLAEADLPVFLDPVLVAGAVGTTVLMVRFLWVAWPRARRSASVSRIGRAAWLVLATSVLWGPWLVPWDLFRAAAAAAVAPEALWSALWPLVVGLVISLAVARHRHIFAFRIDDVVPAGDLIVVVEAVGRALRSSAVALREWVGRGLKRGVLAVRIWVEERLANLEVAAYVEARLKAQAWEWVWILIVGAALMASAL